MRIIQIIKLVLISKWKFLPPKNKKILIYDAGAYNPFHKYLKKYGYNLFFKRGEQINLFIILKCILQFNISFCNYFKNYLKFCKPNIIITGIDNDTFFYQISERFKIKTIALVNGNRTYWNDIFINKSINNKINKKNYFIDYLLTLDDSTLKIYDSFISGKKKAIGSFKNNLQKIKKIKKKKEILFISGFRGHHYYNDKTIYKTKKGLSLSHKFFYQNDEKLIKWLSRKCELENLKLNILPKSNLFKDAHKDFLYYSKVLKNKKFNFLYKNSNSYKILRKYKYIIAIELTLANESLSNSFRTGLIFNRPYIFPILSRAFNYNAGLKKKGAFWTCSNLTKEFDRVFDFVVYGEDKKWFTIFKKLKKRNIIVRNDNNTFFSNLIKKLV